MNLEDLDLPDKMKAEDLAVLFEKHLSEFYSSKNKDLRKHQQEKKDQQM